MIYTITDLVVCGIFCCFVGATVMWIIGDRLLKKSSKLTLEAIDGWEKSDANMIRIHTETINEYKSMEESYEEALEAHRQYAEHCKKLQAAHLSYESILESCLPADMQNVRKDVVAESRKCMELELAKDPAVEVRGSV